jgi:single-stranded DNA-binding protein
MNRVFLVGNITGNIHFDILGDRPFLRLILMAGRPRIIAGLRIVLWDDKATKFFPYLQRGSEIGVIGHLMTREYKGKIITEVEANHLILLRNINWENGSKKQEEMTTSTSASFIVGKVAEDIQFKWLERNRKATCAREDAQHLALLRLLISNGEYLDGLRIAVYGALAQLAYPYLRAGSVIAVDGHLQTKDCNADHKLVEVTAEHIAFLQNIDWAAGAAAQRRMMEDSRAEE